MRSHHWKLKGEDEFQCRACGLTDRNIGIDSQCFPPEGPNPECHFPAECAKTGRCPRDPVCMN